MLVRRVLRLFCTLVTTMLLFRTLEQKVYDFRCHPQLHDLSLPCSTIVAIQNITFGGIQGFTRKPSTAWKSDSGKFAGVVHQERGLTYALIYGAGHLVPRDAPDLVGVPSFLLHNSFPNTFDRHLSSFVNSYWVITSSVSSFPQSPALQQ